MHFTLCDLVTDITQNAAESGADLVELDVRETDKEFWFAVKDNGKGMDPDEVERAKDPFVTDGIKHPHRKVGLGIPFLIQTALQSGGGWDLQSQKHRGTTVSAWFDMTNVDTPPVGELSGMFRTVLLFEGPGEILVRRTLKSGERDIHYEVRKSGLLDALGDLEDSGSLILMDQYLRSMEEDEAEEDLNKNNDDRGEENG
jgi:hypothetical protein